MVKKRSLSVERDEKRAVPIKKERSKQFSAAAEKFGGEAAGPEARLAAFLDIELNRQTPQNERLDREAEKVYSQRKPSIFAAQRANAFSRTNTFVAVFAHPTYTVEYSKLPHIDMVKIMCSNINPKFLFKNKDNELQNLLPNVTAFRVQINDEAPAAVKSVSFEDKKLKILMKFTTDEIITLLPMTKCVIYLNILTNKDWVVPQELLNMFAQLQLQPPNFVPSIA
ncbi:unknown [Antheraea pernyi nucleopolyhedrovirus]|uniref:hypothetical protein n=1 Tax=Antheraea pernyi nuclear polyhedrosis virus TaxID=161494 RepID=UPI0001597083|nr:hypothetical protein APNV_p027 [Antheraea pernyi nucleopolyhedrovirus]ABF50376.2 unknown [Antheraea pernyi nucleopolyhedrovirus]